MISVAKRIASIGRKMRERAESTDDLPEDRSPTRMIYGNSTVVSMLRGGSSSSRDCMAESSG